MDREDLNLEDNLRALEDLRRTNRWLLGYGPVIRTLLPLLHQGQTVLDVGAGMGDVGAALARAARRRGRPVRMVAVDFKLRHLAHGRRPFPDQLRVVASAEALPFATGSVDWSFSSLFFHHFDGATNRRILSEMERVSSAGVAVVDLLRSRLLSSFIRPLLRWVLRAGPVATFDGTLSVAQSWTWPALQQLTQDLPGARLVRRFPFRFALVLPPGRAGGEKT
jgi:ubiquinone/menaquinone biosynthesis C-methylase UbiE